MLSKLGVVYRHAISDGIPKRSFYVAMVVGTVLNLINQGEVLFGASSINWTKIILTYSVPYAVATYGAISYRLLRPYGRAERHDLSGSSKDAKLETLCGFPRGKMIASPGFHQFKPFS